jgi:cell division inhibitor SepF
MSIFQRLQDALGKSDSDLENYGYDGNESGELLPSEAAVPPDPVRPVHGNKVVEMPGLNAKAVEFIVMEPRTFEDMPAAIAALRSRKAVILNLSHMTAAQAQRAVDYVAGGTFAIDGDQERLGEKFFLFTPSFVQINRPARGAAPPSSRPAQPPAPRSHPIQNGTRQP